MPAIKLPFPNLETEFGLPFIEATPWHGSHDYLMCKGNEFSKTIEDMMEESPEER